MLSRFAMSVCVVILLSLASTVGLAADSRSLGPFDMVDFRGRRWTQEDFKNDTILVVAMLGTECPLAKLYSHRLSEIENEYSKKSVRVIGVMSNRQDSLEEIAAFASRQKITYPLLKDAGNRFADQIDARRTPEVFVYDRMRELRYRGRIDDQYGIGYIRDEPRCNDLRLAIDAIIEGQNVAVEKTEAVGCIIGRTNAGADDSKSHVTFGGKVAEILNRRCVECHREGEIAPFALTDYDEAAGWAEMIAEVVTENRMPPWNATDAHARFANDRSLTKAEKETLVAWAEAGAPAGDLSKLPTIPERVSGWLLPRKPDLILPVSTEPVKVPATGTVRYQYFRVDPKLNEDRWIEAAELRPGNREVVHHILAFATPKGQREGLNGARGFLVGYVPGARLELAPKGYAKRIPAGSDLIFQVHYTPIGSDTFDQSELGICFADSEAITHEIITTSAVQPRLNIPPGEPNYETNAVSPRFPKEATLLSMSPHMHVRGKSFRYELETFGGQRTTLLDIPNYDFNWQTTYVLDPPMKVPAASRILCKAVYDNSEGNLNNPDPSANVRWGDQTWDEMMIGYYHYAIPIDPEAKNEVPSLRKIAEALIRKGVILQKFDELDSDKDGRLLRNDTPNRLLKTFDDLDTNRDKILDRSEVESAKL